MGTRINGGRHGTPPALDLAKNQDLEFGTDFRQVCATILGRWLECPTARILGGQFSPLPFI